jgi:hypothetical protein
MKQNSSYLSRLHETTIYGDEKSDVPALKLFSREEVSDLTIKVSAFWTYTYVQVFYIGEYFDYLSDNQKQELLAFVEFMEAIDDSKIFSLSEEETKRLFPFI